MKREALGLLADVSAVDLADETGSFCAKLLADLGASVTRVETVPGSGSRHSGDARSRRRNRRRIALDPKSPGGKRSLLERVREADVLVESFSAARLNSLGLEPARLRRACPRLIHLSITPFGRTGPRRGYPSSDSTLAAWGGQMHVSGIAAGRPLKLFGPQTFYAASLFGANAVLLGLRRRRITGQGCHIDLSVQEAVVSTLDHVMADHFCGQTPAGRDAAAGPAQSFFMLPCRDGFAAIPVMRNWEILRDLVNAEADGAERLGDRWEDEAYRERHYRRFVDAVSAWTARRRKRELFTLGQAMGLPWAPVESLEEVARSPQLKARRFFSRSASRRGGGRDPGLPFQCSISSTRPSTAASAPSQDVSEACAAAGWGRILRGIRVLDLTRMLSGPYATRVLGDFGAEVIKVQSRRAATGAERNDTPYFRTWNRNKRSIGLDLNHPGSRDILLELVSKCDVVVENFSPRVLANWDLGYALLRSVKPGLILAGISAMGRTGPWRNHIGFAPTFHALSGLVSATSAGLDVPVDPGYAYGDVVAGLYAALAILSAIGYRDRTGRGINIDLSAYEALCTLVPPGASSAQPWACFPCRGTDRWCVIEIANEREWRSLCRISCLDLKKTLSYETWNRDAAVRAELNARIARWTSHLKAGTVVRRLEQAGIAAGIVQSARDLAADPQLAARRFFIPLAHPKHGALLSDRSALWPWNEAPREWLAAPVFGEANGYVCMDLLGRSEAELRSLISRGILEE